MEYDKLDGMSLNVEQVELDKLRGVFPQCFAEGKLDLSKLLALLGEYDDNDFEKYKFEWKGKSESLRLAQQRSMGTLRPAPAESVDWDTTQNVYIEGDNLEVLKLLQTSYYRRVKMIYIDPPYNTGNDFVYEDDFKDPINRYKEVTAQTTKSNPETMGRYHTNWLNMMYPRLRLASNLLRDDGVIFISIDDNERDNLKKLCNETFGEENFICDFIWKSKSGGANDSRYVAIDHEYIVCYGKNIGLLSQLMDKNAEVTTSYNQSDEKGRYALDRLDKQSIRYSQSLDYEIMGPNGEKYKPQHKDPQNPNATWRWSKDTVTERYNELVFKNGCIYTKNYEKDSSIVRSLLIDERFGRTRTGKTDFVELMGQPFFSSPKPVKLLNLLCSLVTSNNDIILDFFSGSGTTAHAVMQLNAEDGGNRKFIMVQLPEVTDEKSEAYKAGYKNICEIGKERIRRAGAKIKTEWEAGQVKRNDGLFAVENEPQSPPDTGFKVFKLDTSNLKTWNATPVDSDDPQQMELLLDRMNDMIDTIKPDRTDTDMVYEIMLKMGVPLTYPVIPVDVGGKRAYSIGEESLLLICLQEGLTADMIERMAEDYLPSKMILSKKCFADDTALSNAHYILKNREIELKLV